MDVLQLIAKAVVVVFVVSSMLSIGLATPISQIVAPLRRPIWVLRALVANFVLAPAVALSIAHVLPLEPGYKMGLLLLAFAAGAPFLTKVAEIGRADIPSATALMVLLMAMSVLFMPLALPLFVKGVQVDPWRIAAPLIALMLVPLVLGAGVRHLAPRGAARVLPAISLLSNIGFVAVVLFLCGLNLPALADVLGSGAIGAAILFVMLLFAGAWALGEPNPAGRRLLGYATGARNIGAALVAAGASSSDPKTLVMLIVTGMVGLGLLGAVAGYVRRRTATG